MDVRYMFTLPIANLLEHLRQVLSPPEMLLVLSLLTVRPHYTTSHHHLHCYTTHYCTATITVTQPPSPHTVTITVSHHHRVTPSPSLCHTITITSHCHHHCRTVTITVSHRHHHLHVGSVGVYRQYNASDAQIVISQNGGLDWTVSTSLLLCLILLLQCLPHILHYLPLLP